MNYEVLNWEDHGKESVVIRDYLLTCSLEWVPKTVKIYSFKDGYPGLHPTW